VKIEAHFRRPLTAAAFAPNAGDTLTADNVGAETETCPPLMNAENAQKRFAV
jgi:hypothetical protein